MRKIAASFLLALQNIKAHFYRTMLSLLGIVIGVASLVAILSLIDGMEKFARDQITQTTSLKSVLIHAESIKKVQGINIRKDSIKIINYQDFVSLQKHLTRPSKSYLFNQQGVEFSFTDSIKLAAVLHATSSLESRAVLVTGELFTANDLLQKNLKAVVNESFANQAKDKLGIENIIGKKIKIKNDSVDIVGVIKDEPGQSASVFCPITLFNDRELQQNIPLCVIESKNIEDVTSLKTEAQAWLRKHYGDMNDFSVDTNEFRVAQATRGFKLFRIIMGLIVGISVLVGGIGVMNVLLISVTERTVEIGVRKAVGANKKDIILQFLSESITISTFGSLLGLIFGILGTMVIVPIIKSVTGAPFEAAYTTNTFITITLISIIVGIVFGTYPAIRAARLDPVEAIRKD